MSTIHFTVRVPTDQGFLGRECNSPACKKYFRVHADCVKPTMHCPYCGKANSNTELHTPDQLKFLMESAKEQAIAHAHDLAQKAFGDLSKKLAGNKFVKVTVSRSSYRPKTVRARYTERKVDSELTCPECGVLFQVLGVFGYCPGCKAENMLIYDANIAVIRSEIAKASDPNRALRHAYGDLVSTFEHFCGKKSASIHAEKPSFQDLFASRKFFKEHKGIDILDGVSIGDNLCLRRIFQKRHAYQHAQGKITERYARKIPEDDHLLGTSASLSLEEFEEGARVMRMVIGRLAN
jgi:hypothetical protein